MARHNTPGNREETSEHEYGVWNQKKTDENPMKSQKISYLAGQLTPYYKQSNSGRAAIKLWCHHVSQKLCFSYLHWHTHWLYCSSQIMLRRLKDAVSVLNVCGKPWPAVLHVQTLMGILVHAERLQTKTLQAASLPQAWYYGQLVGSKSNPGV